MLSNGTGASHGPKGQGRASKLVAEKDAKNQQEILVRPHRGREKSQMRNKDKSRKWMWWFLGIVAAMQLYFVRELLAAFALFALGFAVLASLFAGVYLLQKAWQSAVVRVADSTHPVVEAARRGMYAVEDFGRRPLRRPGSAAAR